ncbi:MAG TPA: hypothetical protein VGW38_06835 [Chloroflexota bacterium]|nr:hypothetical protein [Chloroflexota bacterium]
MSDGRGNTSAEWRVLAAGAVAVALVGALVGFWFGSARNDAFETVGTAYSTKSQIGLEAEGWSYNIPLDVQWRDAAGTWHEGGRPECLPPSNTSLEGIRVTAVPVEVRGAGFRHVVAVHCAD